jgi:serine/threonine protein kinase
MEKKEGVGEEPMVISKKLASVLLGAGMEAEVKFLATLKDASLSSESTGNVADSVFLDVTYEELAKRRNDADIGDSIPLWHADVNRFDKEECRWITGPSRRDDVYFSSHGDPRFVVKEKSRIRREAGYIPSDLEDASRDTFSAAQVTAIKRGNCTVRLMFQPLELGKVTAGEREAMLTPKTSPMVALEFGKWGVEKVIHLSFPFLDQLAYVCGAHGRAVSRSHRHYGLIGKRFHRMVHDDGASFNRSMRQQHQQQQQEIVFSGGDYPRRTFDVSFLRETAACVISKELTESKSVIRAVAETRSDASTMVTYIGTGVPFVDAIRIAKAEGIRSLNGLAMAIMESTYNLHSNGVAHCNIKPNNIMVSRSGLGENMVWTATFIGLSCAAFWTINEQRSMFGLGAPGYTPPDVLADGSRKRSTFRECAAADCWAIGCIIFAMFSEKWTGKDSLPWVNMELELLDRREGGSAMASALNGPRNGPEWKLLEDTPSWVRDVLDAVLLCQEGSGRSMKLAFDLMHEKKGVSSLKDRWHGRPQAVKASISTINPKEQPMWAQYMANALRFSDMEEEIAVLLFIGDGRKHPEWQLPQRRIDIALVRDAVWWSIVVALSRKDRRAGLPIPSDMFASLAVLFVGGLSTVSLMMMRTDAATMATMADIVTCSETLSGQEVYKKTVASTAADFVSRCTIEYLKFCGSAGPVMVHPLGLILRMCEWTSAFGIENRGEEYRNADALATFVEVAGCYLRQLYLKPESMGEMEAGIIAVCTAQYMEALMRTTLFSAEDLVDCLAIKMEKLDPGTGIEEFLEELMEAQKGQLHKIFKDFQDEYIKKP